MPQPTPTLEKKTGYLVLERTAGQTIFVPQLGVEIVVNSIAAGGGSVRLAIAAPRSATIIRGELATPGQAEITRRNRAAW